MSQPKVSVIIPVYNVEQYLAECLDSILAQTLREIELICVNDGSTDRSGDILRDYAAADGRIRVLTQENAGMGVARNEGLKQAQGDYVYFMDSDDWLEAQALEALWRRCDSLGLDALFFAAQSFFETPELEQAKSWYASAYRRRGTYPDVMTGQQAYLELRGQRDYYSSIPLILLRRDFIVTHGLSFPAIVHEDEYYAFAALLSAERVGCVPDVWYHRRVRANSTMTQSTNLADSIGYFTVFSLMTELISRMGESLSPDAVSESETHRGIILNSARRCYLQLDAPQPAVEDAFFSATVVDWCRERQEREQLKEQLRNANERRKELYELSQRLRQELSTQRKELGDRLRQANADKSALNQRLKQANADKSALNQRLKQTYAEKSELSAKLKQTYAEKSELNAKLKQTYAEKSELSAKLKQTYAEKSEINAKLKQTYQEKFDRGVEIKALRAELEQTQTQLAQTQAELRDTQSALKAVRTALKEAQSTLGYRIQRKLTGDKK